MIPIEAKALAVVGIVLAIYTAGYKTSGHFSDAKIATINADWEKKYNVAKDARLAEEMLARAAERKADKRIADAAEEFERTRQNEKAAADRTITDLRNDVTRLRVSTRNPHRSSVPGAPAGACGSDGKEEATLSPTVAARLAGRYAEYNALITQLELCQATIVSDRATVK